MVALAAGIPPEVGIPAPQVLERVVVGQQLGRLLDDARTQGALRARASRTRSTRTCAARASTRSIHPTAAQAGGGAKLVQVSKLEHAAALAPLRWP